MDDPLPLWAYPFLLLLCAWTVWRIWVMGRPVKHMDNFECWVLLFTRWVIFPSMIGVFCILVWRIGSEIGVW